MIAKRGLVYPCLNIISNILKNLYLHSHLQLYSNILPLILGMEPELCLMNCNKEHFCHLLDTLRNSKAFSTGRGEFDEFPFKCTSTVENSAKY